jgi:hypothetical protein
MIIFLMLVVLVPAQESIAISLKVKGNVELTRADKQDKLTIGAELYNGDQLESGEEAFAALKFIDGSSIVRLFPLSILTIYTESDSRKLNKRAKLDLGELWTRVESGSGSFEVETPTTVVSVKGTQFLLAVGNDGSTTLYTVKGQVELKNKNDQETALVGEGEKAFSLGSGLIEVVPYDLEEVEGKIAEDDDAAQTLEIQLQNGAGEKKSILIELE